MGPINKKIISNLNSCDQFNKFLKDAKSKVYIYLYTQFQYQTKTKKTQIQYQTKMKKMSNIGPINKKIISNLNI